MKNEFDDILKKRWEEIHFPVDEKHRQDMIELLNQPRRRKGIFYWWLGGIAIITFVGGVLLYASYQNDPVNPVSTDTDNISAQVINDQPSHERDHSGASNLHSVPQAQPSISKQTQHESKLSSESEPVKKEDLEKNKNINSKKPIIAANVPDKTMLSEKANGSGLVPYNSGNNTSENSSVESGAEISPAINAVTQQNNFEEPFVNRERVITDPLARTIISDLDFSREILAWPIEPSTNKFHPINLFAEAGAGYIPQLKPEVASGWSVKAGGGVSYGLFVHTDITMAGGYMIQKDGFDFERTSTVRELGFSLRSNLNTLTPDKLHFIYSRFGVQQHLRRHILTASIGAQWLYGAQGNIVIRTQDQIPSGNSNTTRYTWLSLDGMQRLLWNSEVGYGYQVSPWMSLHLGIKYYFTSLKEEDSSLADEGYYWNGKFAPINPSFTIQYRFYGSK